MTDDVTEQADLTLAELEHRVRACLAEIGKEWAFLRVDRTPGYEHPTWWISRGSLTEREQWLASEIVSAGIEPARCLRHSTEESAALTAGLPQPPDTCEAFGRWGLDDCGATRGD